MWNIESHHCPSNDDNLDVYSRSSHPGSQGLPRIGLSTGHVLVKCTVHVGRGFAEDALSAQSNGKDERGVK